MNGRTLTPWDSRQVKLATKHNIGFLAQGGRHGIAYSFQSLKNGWSIDLSLLRSVAVDKRAATVTVGAGVRFGEIYDPLDKAGFMIRESTSSVPRPSRLHLATRHIY